MYIFEEFEKTFALLIHSSLDIFHCILMIVKNDAKWREPKRDLINGILLNALAGSSRFTK